MSAMTEGAPSSWTAIRTIAGVTWTRLRRGRALWIALPIAALPAVFGAIVSARRGGHAASASNVLSVCQLVIALLPALLVAGSIGEEIEERTSTYLWSRPLARWSVLAGKLLALAPIVVALGVGGWIAAVKLATGELPSAASCGAVALGGLAACLVAGAVATVVPRHSMALAITYMMLDLFLGALPFSLNAISLTRNLRTLALGGAGEAGAAALALAIIAGLWSALALARVRRLEV